MGVANTFAVLGAGLSIGVGAMGSAIGEGFIAMKALEALGRQPRCQGKLLRTMLIGQAVTETAAIFALVVSFLLIFQNDSDSVLKGWAFLAAGISMGFGTIGSGIGAGLPGGAACEGLGKQPENADILTFHMLIGQAVSQTAVIFALTVALILIIVDPGEGTMRIYAVLGAGIAMGLGSIGPGIGIGYVAKQANEAIGKNPRFMGLLTRTMLVGQAVTETTSIYAVVVSLILIFVI